jgi:hypothetical protein
MGKFYKRIQIEIANAEDIDKVISQYGLLLKKIEEESFHSQKLKDLQQKLLSKENASVISKRYLIYLIWIPLNLLTASLLMEPSFFNLHVLKNY